MIFLQLIILLICIFIGARMSGIGLGVMGMIGLLIFLFVFGLKPSDPSILAGKILRKNPSKINILGPIITNFFKLFAGTAHISYSIIPIIAEVAIKAKIRPERAMSKSVIAAHMAITASPVSTATVITGLILQSFLL